MKNKPSFKTIILRIFIGVTLCLISIPVLLFIGLCVSKSGMLDFAFSPLNRKETKIIKEHLKSYEYTNIEYKGIQEYEAGYSFVFYYTRDFDYDYDISAKEAIEIFKGLMDFIDEENLSIENSALYLELKFSTDLGEGDLLLSNCYDREADTGNVSYLSVSDLNDISAISEICEELKYIRVSNIESAEKILSLNLSNIKEMHFSDCRYSNGEDFPSDLDLSELKENYSDCEIKISHSLA